MLALGCDTAMVLCRVCCRRQRAEKERGREGLVGVQGTTGRESTSQVLTWGWPGMGWDGWMRGG